MTEAQIRDHVAKGKTDRFTPTQCKMQLAFMGATNDQINAAIPTDKMWKIDGRTGEVVSYRHILIPKTKTTHCGEGTKGWILTEKAAREVASYHASELCTDCSRHLELKG